MKKCLISIVSVILSVAMLFTIPASAARPRTNTGNTTLYISELIMAYGDTKQEAQDKLTEAGYTPIDVNMNRRESDDTSNNGKKYVYLGYKATNDPKRAITDITTMNMNGDYTISSYAEVLADSYAYFQKMGMLYETTAKAFKKQYEKGTTSAKKAYELLNMYYDPNTNMRMGDFFLSDNLFRADGKGGTWENRAEGKIYKDPIVQVLAEANSDIILVFDRALAMAVASYDADNNFYTRFKTVTENDVESANQVELYEKANILIDTVEALGRIIKRSETYIQRTAQESAKETGSEATDVQMIADDDGEALTLVEAYTLAQHMKMFKYGDTTLYDIFTADKVEARDLYPVVLALGDGQYESIVIGGVFGFLKGETLTEQLIDEYAECEGMYDLERDILQIQVDMQNAAMKGSDTVEAGTALSIYTAVNTDLFNGNVGVTRNANTAMAYGDSKCPIFGNISLGAEIALLAGAGIALAGTIASIVHLFNAKSILRSFEQAAANSVDAALLASTKQQYEQTSKLVSELIEKQNSAAARQATLCEQLHNWRPGSKVPYDSVSKPYQEARLATDRFTDQLEEALANRDALSQEIQRMQPEAVGDVPATPEAVKSASNAVRNAKIYVGIALSVLMIVSGVLAGLELYNYYHPDYKEIPLMMMDHKYDKVTKEYHYVTYNNVLTTDGEAGDVNAMKERQWIALYYTKDKDSGGAPLKVSYFAGEKSNFAPIHTFNDTQAYNMNQFTYASQLPIINLSFEKGNRDLLLASSLSTGGKHAIIASVGLLAGFGLAFGASVVVVKGKKKKQTA